MKPLMNYVRQCGVLLMTTLLVNACTVGPDYKRPPVVSPVKFKESRKDWRVAEPQDALDRGQWWTIYHDKQLAELEQDLNRSNQTIATADANYRQASDLVDEARASYFPTLTGAVSITRQKNGSGSSSFSSVSSGSSSTSTSSGVATTGGASKAPFTSHTILLNASWEPDIWGTVHRTVEAASSGAQADAALLALTRLSAQASLAQYYFELRGLDRDQQLLNDTVSDYKKSLQLTRNRYAAGVASRADVVQAQAQLESTQATAINNGILRAQYEHAIAVLVGKPPADFSIVANGSTIRPPVIPIAVPSLLLERRPDIAQAERLMSQANAQIGVAVAAYYPSLIITGSGSSSGQNYNHWFSLPALSWAVGPQLAETILDGGLRSATLAAARAGYDSTVASYRQTVLAAFQDTEDNLVSVRILRDQSVELDKAAASARRALQLVMNEYKAGTVDYSAVITAQTAAYTAEKSAADVNYLRLTSSVGLIKSLGGGWSTDELKHA